MIIRVQKKMIRRKFKAFAHVRFWLLSFFIFEMAATLCPVFAQETSPQTREEEIDLDALDSIPKAPEPVESKKPAGHPEAHPVEAVITADLTLEYFQGEKEELTFGSNHEYVVLGVRPRKNAAFMIEVVERVYWEFQFYFSKRNYMKAGKLAIPFGPLFLHQLVGGLVEKPLPGGGGRQLLVPGEWTEYGMEFDRKWIDSYPLTLVSRIWITNGLQGYVKIADQTVDFTASAGARRDNNKDKAVGLRLQNMIFGRYQLNFSAYTAKWSTDLPGESFYEGDRMVLANVDAELGYGSIPVPFLRNFRIRPEYALLRTQSTQREGAQSLSVPWHNKSASLFELTYNGLHRICDIQFRTGNYDDCWDVKNSKDLVNHNLALIFEVGRGIHVIPRYMWNRERVNETKDDYFFIKFFVEL